MSQERAPRGWGSAGTAGPALLAAVACLLAVVACSPPTPPLRTLTPLPTATGPATTAAPPSEDVGQPTDEPSPEPPRPSGAPAALPTAFGVDLAPGLYGSSPPLDLAFTFELDAPGWQTGHLDAEVFDIIRFDGLPESGLPARSLGFALPTTIRGAGAGAAANLPVANLAPADALAALAARDDLVASEVTDLELFGRAAAQVDLHAKANNTPIWSGSGGTFGLATARDLRLLAVALDDGGLLLVMIQARANDLEAASEQAFDILDTVVLAVDQP